MAKGPRLKVIRITKSPSEMQVILETIEKKIGKPDIRLYMRQEIAKILKKVDENPTLIPEETSTTKVQKDYCMNDQTYCKLKELSDKTRKPISTLIDELVIIPLFQID